MGAYTIAAFVAVAALGWILWLAWPREDVSYVELPASSIWVHAVLDDGVSQQVLERGERVRAEPGEYRLTLLDADGGSEQRELTVGGELTRLEP
jgi:hypothetical protein